MASNSDELTIENATIEVLAGRIEGRSVVCLRLAGDGEPSYLVLDDAADVHKLAERLQRAARRMDAGLST